MLPLLCSTALQAKCDLFGVFVEDFYIGIKWAPDSETVEIWPRTRCGDDEKSGMASTSSRPIISVSPNFTQNKTVIL